MRAKPLNAMQLFALRQAMVNEAGHIPTDRCTGKALAARGYARELGHTFVITRAGRERARKAADVWKTVDGMPLDESLMRDLDEASPEASRA